MKISMFIRGFCASITFTALSFIASNVYAVAPTISSVGPTEVNVNTQYTYQIQASDPEGAPITYSFGFAPAGITISEQGLVQWLPSTEDAGEHLIKIVIEDAEALTAEEYIKLDVIDPNNSAPVFDVEPITEAFINQVYQLNAAATDPDGDTIEYTVASWPEVPGISIDNNGVVTWTPDASLIGEYWIRVIADDKKFGVTELSYSLKVLDPANNAPVIQNKIANRNIAAGQVFTYDLQASDIDGDVLSFNLVIWPEIPEITISNQGVVEWTPTLDNLEDHYVTVYVSDGKLGEDSHSFKLTVVNDGSVPTNTAPTALSETVNGNEDESVSFTLSASDPESDALTYTLGAVNNGVLTGTAPNLTFTPVENFTGTTSFTFTANDGEFDSNTATITLNISSINDAPIAEDQSVSTNEDVSLAITLAGSDIDGDALTYEIATAPTNGTLTGTAPNLTYTPNENYHGSDSFTFTVNDGVLTSSEAQVSITVNPENDLPSATSQTLNTNEDTPVAITLTASDVDGDALTYSVGLVENGVLSGTAPNLVFTPNANFTGSTVFSFTANDGAGDSDPATISINVAPVNDAPTANANNVIVDEDASVAITLTGSDIDGDTLTYSLTSNPANGSLSGTPPNVTFTPNTNFNGSDSFAFTVNDGQLDSTEAVISITVNPVNDAPVANSQNVTTNQEEAVSITLTATDVDGDALTFVIESQPENGAVSGSSPNFTYTPDVGFYGLDGFTFSVNDGVTSSGLEAVSITVVQGNVGPEFTSSPVTSVSEYSTYNYSAVAQDPNDDDITYGAAAGLSNIAVNPDSGVTTWSPSTRYVQSISALNENCFIEPLEINPSLEPVIKWEWNSSLIAPEFNQVMSTPLVAQTNDDNGDGFINEADVPDVIFTAYEGADGGSADGIIRILSGSDGSELNAFVDTIVEGYANIAVADIDGDSEIEIIAATRTNQVVAINLDGTELWRSTEIISIGWGGPTIADLNADGAPEILIGTSVFNNQGQLQWQATNIGGTNGGFPVVADIDVDGDQEVLFGLQIYDHEGQIIHSFGDGFVAVANFDTTPELEIVMSANGTVRLYNLQMQEMWSENIPGGGAGAPTIADLDGDGLPEVAVAGASRYVAFDTDGQIIWMQQTQDTSSRRTGSSVFDFNGDGRAEVIYGDEYTFYMFDGASGDILYSIPNSTGTTLEYPIVADVDNDNHADIVLVANQLLYRLGRAEGESYTGIRVFEGANNEWVDTRSIWNQHAYNINNINDDGTVPTNPESPSLTHNSFRLNAFLEGPALAQADLRLGELNLNSSSGEISVVVSNQGLRTSQSSTLTLYSGAPQSGGTILSSITTQAIIAGGSVVQTLPIDVTLLDQEVVAVINETQAVEECNYSNNQTIAGYVQLSASDGDLSDYQSYLINVTNVNDAPQIQSEPSALTAMEYTAFTYQVNASDIDLGDALVYSLSSPNSGLSINARTGLVSWTPDFGDAGTATFDVTVTDLSGASTTQSFIIDVAPSDLPPLSATLSVSPASVYMGETITIDVDVENDLPGLVVSAALNGEPLTLDSVYSATVTTSVVGANPVVVTLNDGRGDLVLNETFEVFEAVNEPPVSADINISVDEDTSALITLDSVDPENDSLSYAVFQPSVGTLSGDAPGLTYTPPQHFNGDVSFTYTASDGVNNSNIATVNITILGLNDAPTAQDQTVALNEDEPITFNVSVLDVDGDIFNVDITQEPINGSIFLNGNSIQYIPRANFFGTDTIRYFANDGQVDSRIATVTIDVQPVNDQPEFTSAQGNISLLQGESFTYVYNVVDLEDDYVPVTFDSSLTGQIFEQNNQLEISTVGAAVGQYTVNLLAADSGGATAEQQFTISVVGSVSEVFSITSQPDFIAERNQPYSYLLESNDSSLVNYTLIQGPEGASLTGGQISWISDTEQTLSSNQNIASCADYEGMVLGEFGSSSLFVESLFNPESFPTLYKPIPSTLLDVTDVDTQISLGVLGRELAASSWGFSDTAVYTTSEPAWSGVLTRLVVRGDDGDDLGFAPSVYSYTGPNFQPTPHDERALGFHNDTWASRGGHDVCETENNFGVINGQANDTYEDCRVENWGSYGVQLGTPNPARWKSDLAIIDASVNQSRFVNIVLGNRGLQESGTVTVHILEEVDGVFTALTSQTIDSLQRYSTAELNFDASRLIRGNIRIILDYYNSEERECVTDNNRVDLYKFSVLGENSEGETAIQEFWVATLDNTLKIQNEPIAQVYAGFEYSFRPTVIGGTPPYSYSIVEIPPTSSLSETGELTWTTTTLDVGAHNVNILITDSAGQAVNAIGSVEVIALPSNEAPVALSVPPTQAIVGEEYVYNAEFVDPEGDPITILSPSTLGEDFRFTYTPTQDDYNFAASRGGFATGQIEVMDDQGNATLHSWPINLVLPNSGDVQPDVEPIGSRVIPVDYLMYEQVLATSPLADTLTYELTTRPEGMEIDAEGVISWQPSLSQVGVHEVTVLVANSQTSASTLFTVEVRGPLNITSEPPRFVISGNQYGYQLVLDSSSSDLDYELTASPAQMEIDSSGQITWATTESDLGNHNIVVEVSDGIYTAYQDYVLNVGEVGSQPLILSAGLSSESVVVGESVELWASVEGALPGVEITATLDGLPLELDPFNRVVFIPEAGAHIIVVTANDGRDDVTQELTLLVTDPSDSVDPVAQLISPADGSTITSITDVIATAADDNLASYRVLYKRKSVDTWSEIATGTNSITNQNVGVFDPTLLLNGIYNILVEARDVNNRLTTDYVTVNVESDLKVGHFSFTVNDLTVPLAGIPIEINRTYDSRRREELLDFGYGWSVDYQNVLVEESRTLGLGWEHYQSGILGFDFCLRPIGTPFVTVTLPNGDQEVFNLTVTALNGNNCRTSAMPQFVTLSFVPAGDTQSQLIALDGDGYYDSNADIIYEDIANQTPKDPSRYQLTTRAGYIYTLDQNFGVERIEDPNGYTITYDENGVHHSSGKSVLFERNAEGIIDAVIDPKGLRIEYTRDANNDLTAVLDRDEITETEYAYLAGVDHYVEDIIDPLDRTVLRNIYDEETGRLTGQCDQNNVCKSFGHDLAARRSIVTDLDGRTKIYDYDENGNVRFETLSINDGNYPSDIVTEYTYDANDNQETKTINGITWTTLHDPNTNDVTSSCNDLNECVYYNDYNARGQEGSITDERGHTYAMHYDANGNLEHVDSPEITDPNTGELVTPRASNVINAQGQVESTTDLRGLTTTYTYYPSGHVNAGQKHTESNPVSGTMTYTYDDNNNVLTETRQRTVNEVVVEETTTYTYDNLDRVTHTTFHDGSYTETIYDLAGNVDLERDRFGNWTDYTYDAYGRVTLTEYPDGSTEVRTYTREGLLDTVTDTSGRITRNEYDDAGRLWRVHNEEDNTFTETRYNLQGWVTDEYDANGNRTQYTYDDAGRREHVIRHFDDGTTQTHTFSYYPNGELFTETDANNHTTTYILNELDQRVETQFHNGTSTQEVFDFMGTRIRSIDQEDSSTRFGYDSLGRLTTVTPEVQIDGVDVPDTSYTCDEVGNKLTQTDANGHRTEWSYDSFGRVLTRTLPLGQQESFVYNAQVCTVQSANIPSGEPASLCEVIIHTDFNQDTITTVKDNMGRVDTMTYSKDGRVETYTYYPNGQTHTVSVELAGVTEVTTYTYYAHNQLLHTETQPDGVVKRYEYDDVGNRTLVEISRAGVVSSSTEYTYDELNRLETTFNTATPTEITQYTYDDVGNLDNVIYPNGLITDYDYNTVNQLTDVYTRDLFNTVVNHFSYILTETGRRHIIEEMDGRTTAYCYDELYRLEEEVIFDSVASPLFAGCVSDTSGASYVANYEYDWVGNRERSTENGEVKDYDYDQNDRITDIFATSGNVSYGYDANGNTLTESTDGVITKTYTWDSRNKLSSLDQSGLVSEYDYNHNGIRVSKVEQGVTTAFVVDENRDYAQVLEELEGGTQTVAYTYGHDLIEQNRDGIENWFHYDALGSTRALSDDSASLTDSWDYVAFGDLFETTGNTENSYLFAGEQYDQSLDGYYLRARNYDQSVGRFTSMDTWLGQQYSPITLNKYLYANADPVKYVDPTGKYSTALSVGVGLSIGGALVVASQPKISFGGSSSDGGFGFNSLDLTVIVAIHLTTLRNDIYQHFQFVLANESAGSLTEEEEAQKQEEYELAKDFCDNQKPEPGRNDCATLSKLIEHAEQCVSMYEAWDNKWKPGDHAEKIMGWKNRINNLKEEHRRRCTNK